MPRTPRFPPYPSKKHPNGQARIRVGKDQVYLGKWGSPESHQKYNALRAEWVARLSVPGAVPPAGPPKLLTVADLVSAYWRYCEVRHVTKDGFPKQHLDNIARALRPVAILFGSTPVSQFGPKALKAVRSAMVKGYDDPACSRRKPSCRKKVNQMVNLVRGAWRWAEEEELIPAGSWERLRAVRGLTLEDVGRDGVYDRKRPRPPAVPAVLATLPWLNPVVRCMTRVQMLTGARPSELYGLRPCDIVVEGQLVIDEDLEPIDCSRVWGANLDEHKTAATGAYRVLLFGPRAQKELRPFLERRPPDEPIFSPEEARLLALAERRAARRCPVYPRDVRRQERAAAAREASAPIRRPGKCYTRHSYHQAVERAVERANRARLDAGPCRPRDLVPQWNPYGLRRLAATIIASEFGIELARVVLGHRQLKTTRDYVTEDIKKAMEALGVVG